ncbi:MAG: thioredoxin domain-containing protein [Elusimicrobiota bacterium]|jgi:protein-disulfide isomerase
MCSQTGRRAFCAAGVFLCAVLLTVLLRSMTPDYRPQSPEFRRTGPAEAPVEIAVFSDFECGGCRASEEPLRRLQTLFPGKIRILFKHMAWDFHKHALEASVAAECAGEQGRFWEFHDRLFKNQEKWASEKGPEAFFAQLSKELRLDAAAFSACRNGPSAKAAVDADRKEGKDHWVRATPTFFINGKRFVGVRQLRGPGFNLIERIVKK